MPAISPWRPRRALLAATLLALLPLLGGCDTREGARGAVVEPAQSTGPARPEAPAAATPAAATTDARAQQAAPADSAAAPPRSGTAVEVQRLARRDFTVTSTYIGHLLPRERVRLSAEIDGVVEQVHFEEGDAVAQGELLVNISTEQLRVRRDRARADLRLAESSYQRDQELNTKRLLPDAKLDQTRTQRDLARYALRLAEIELAKSQVASPIAGTVKTKGVNVGEFVNKGAFLAEILDVGGVRARVNVPEREVRFLEPGRRVEVSFDALPGEPHTGTVRLVGLEADVQSRTFPVEVALDNARGRLRPGMLARVTIDLEAFRDQLLIPRHAILERERGRVVFVAEDGRAVERAIETGASSAGQVQVLRGLATGERLIVTGHQKLTPGEPIEVRDR